jgi:hypothetical protein
VHNADCVVSTITTQRTDFADAARNVDRHDDCESLATRELAKAASSLHELVTLHAWAKREDRDGLRVQLLVCAPANSTTSILRSCSSYLSCKAAGRVKATPMVAAVRMVFKTCQH